MNDELDIDDILSAIQPAKKELKPTPEQEEILSQAHAKSSLMITAMAGCAKTTSIKLLARKMPLRPSLALAFNVKIKKELEAEFPSHFQVKTLNGLGHMAWCKATNKRCALDEKKIQDILKQLAKDDEVHLGDAFVLIMQLVRKARHAGLVPTGFPYEGIIPDTYESWESLADELYADLNEETHYYCGAVLREAIKQSYAGLIDYDDQIYMSALFGGAFSKYPIVMVDEAQDLSPLNHIQLRKSSSDRLIVVGDPRQAIYAFRGADSNSMANLRTLREDWVDLPLSTTFRCPRSVVLRQQLHAPGFNAADTAPEGEVIDWREKEDGWKIQDLEELGKPVAILCRNNAPIIACALRIIRSGRGCTVMGGEIGKQLVNLSRKVIPDDSTTYDNCLARIEEWRRNETIKARAQEKEERIGIISDKAECLIAVMENGDVKDAGGMRRVLNTMFQKDNLHIILATGHKSKGLEWPVVCHLDPWRIPSKWAKRALEKGHTAPMQQEMNLQYVIETRTKDKLVFANLEDMQ
jgi:hypothetical protein